MATPRKHAPSVRSAHPRAGDALRRVLQDVVDLEHAMADTSGAVSLNSAKASCVTVAQRVMVQAALIAHELRYPWPPRL